MDLTTNAIIAPVTIPAASLRGYGVPTNIARRVRTAPSAAELRGTRLSEFIHRAEIQVAKQDTWLTANAFVGTGMSAAANTGRPPRGVLQ